MAASLTEASLETVSEKGVGYSVRALVSCTWRRMYQRTEVNENLPAQNLNLQ